MEQHALTNLVSNLNFPKLEHGQTVVQLGSCFSTHISEFMRNAGFEVLDNPLGVIFHPIPLAKQILLAFGETSPNPFVQKSDVWLSYDASSTLYAMSETELKVRLQNQLNQLKETLLKASYCFITLGSAHAYRLNSTRQIVANCHQQPKETFTKELSEVDELLEIWTKALRLMKQHNPKLQVVFTVSPVRYVRDGLMENNLSKSVLFQLVHKLASTGTYFPAFEIVNDVLRDYRYFEEDTAHPNSLAIQQVWNVLSEVIFSKTTQTDIKQLFELRKMEAHRLLYPESVEAQRFIQNTQQKRESFLSLHPKIIW
jgi:hypothetical protein